MKAQMQCITGRRSIREGESGEALIKTAKKATGGQDKWKRGGLCAVLIAVLAAGGYAGAGMEQEVQTAAAPVVSLTEIEETVSSMTSEDIAVRYEEDRRQEIALLDSVLDDQKTDEATRKSAEKQKLQIAARMELEAQIRAALAAMGCDETTAVSGAGQLTLFIPEKDAQDDKQTLRILDTVCSVSGIDAADIKIILVKK